MANISYTFLSTYKKCHRRAFLQYILKVVPPDQIDNRPFIVGIVVDWLFNKWVTEHSYEEGWMKENAEDLFEWFITKRKVRFKDSSDKASLIDKTVYSCEKLEEIAFAEHLPERVFETQHEVSFDRGSIHYYGKLDMWFPEELAIWDLKVTKYSKYLDKFQLQFFAWMMEECYGVKVSQLRFMSPLMVPAVKEVEWNPVIKHEVEEAVTTLNFSIANKDWKITSKDCWNCPVARYCEEPTDVKKRTKNDKGGFVLEV